MAERARHRQTLSPDDTVAALQVLAFLAYPHKPDYAITILQEWARHRINLRDERRAWPIREKWSRLEPKLRRLDDMIKRRLKGSYWLRLQVNQRAELLANNSTGCPTHAAGQRACARRFGAPAGEEKNIIRDYWTASRSVAHLGLATGDAILLALEPEERERPWDLTRVAFKPDWVAQAIHDAERNAVVAAQSGVIPLADAIEFLRA